MSRLGRWRRRRAIRRVRPGDGRALEPYRLRHLLTGRELFHLRVPPDAPTPVYTVDVRLWGRQGGDSGRAHVFLDGSHHVQSDLPAVIPVDGGAVEVTASAFGLRRSHFVAADGEEHLLEPDRRSGIGRRLRLERRHPVASRVVAVVSVAVLVVGACLTVVQVAEPLLQVPPVVDRFGRIELPVHVPVGVNVGAAVAAALASVERALRLRHGWLDALAS